MFILSGLMNLKEKDCILAKTYQDLKDFVNSGDEDRFCKAHKGNEKPFTNHWKEYDFCYFDPNLAVKKAWLEGKIIQYYSSFDKWEDLILAKDCNIEECLAFNWDKYEWRIKPTEENEKCTDDNIYVLNMYKIDYFKFFISKYDVSHPIYFGDKEKCTHVMNMVSRNFVHDNKKCAECNCLRCHECEELKKFINNIKFTRRMTNRELARWIAEGNGEVKNINDNCASIIFAYDFEHGDGEVIEDIRIRKWDSDKWEEPLVEVE